MSRRDKFVLLLGGIPFLAGILLIEHGLHRVGIALFMMALIAATAFTFSTPQHR